MQEEIEYSSFICRIITVNFKSLDFTILTSSVLKTQQITSSLKRKNFFKSLCNLIKFIKDLRRPSRLHLDKNKTTAKLVLLCYFRIYLGLATSVLFGVSPGLCKLPLPFCRMLRRPSPILYTQLFVSSSIASFHLGCCRPLLFLLKCTLCAIVVSFHCLPQSPKFYCRNEVCPSTLTAVPNIHPNIFLSKVWSRCSSLLIRVLLADPYVSAGRISVLYVLILVVLDNVPPRRCLRSSKQYLFARSILP